MNFEFTEHLCGANRPQKRYTSAVLPDIGYLQSVAVDVVVSATDSNVIR